MELHESMKVNRIIVLPLLYVQLTYFCQFWNESTCTHFLFLNKQINTEFFKNESRILDGRAVKLIYSLITVSTAIQNFVLNLYDGNINASKGG